MEIYGNMDGSELLPELFNAASRTICQLKGEMMLKKVRPYIGILLVLESLVSLYFWETSWRQEVTMKEVAAASRDIAAGEVISAEMFTSIRVPYDNLIDGALTPGQMSSYFGEAASRNISRNSQVNSSCFAREDEMIGEAESIFVVKGDWIDSRSASIRGGDRISFYSENGSVYLGTFRAAFVRDDNEQSVTTGDMVTEPADPLDRTVISRAPYNVEIIATLDEYLSIRNFVYESGEMLLVVQERG